MVVVLSPDAIEDEVANWAIDKVGLPLHTLTCDMVDTHCMPLISGGSTEEADCASCVQKRGLQIGGHICVILCDLAPPFVPSFVPLPTYPPHNTSHTHTIYTSPGAQGARVRELGVSRGQR